MVVCGKGTRVQFSGRIYKHIYIISNYANYINIHPMKQSDKQIDSILKLRITYQIISQCMASFYLAKRNFEEKNSSDVDRLSHSNEKHIICSIINFFCPLQLFLYVCPRICILQIFLLLSDSNVIFLFRVNVFIGTTLFHVLIKKKLNRAARSR